MLLVCNAYCIREDVFFACQSCLNHPQMPIKLLVCITSHYLPHSMKGWIVICAVYIKVLHHDVTTRMPLSSSSFPQLHLSVSQSQALVDGQSQHMIYPSLHPASSPQCPDVQRARQNAHFHVHLQGWNQEGFEPGVVEWCWGVSC
jgi:hypothetical protein